MQISGKFTVALSPLTTYAEGVTDVTHARMSIDKTFEGELSATSKGEMLSTMTSVQGSAGYVAMEQVQGVLAGKSGGFVLQHFGIMQGEAHELTINVIPNSGYGELKGLSGTMNIRNEDGQHFYDFDYKLDSL